MPKGQQQKNIRERTAFIKRKLIERLNVSTEAERISDLKETLAFLKGPVQYSSSVLISLNECHPSSGRYKHALPKDYWKKVNQFESAIQKLEATAKVFPSHVQVASRRQHHFFSTQQKVLSKRSNADLTETQIAAWKPSPHCLYFLDAHKNAARYLVAKHRLNPEAAIKELNGLDRIQAELLQAAYANGLRGEHILGWKPKPSYRLFNKEHKNLVVYLIKEQGLKPEAAIREVDGLEDVQAKLLHAAYANGLRGEHICAWTPSSEDSFFRNKHKDAALYLIMERGEDPKTAMQEISGLTADHAEELTTRLKQISIATL
jgi:hypothetical protein